MADKADDNFVQQKIYWNNIAPNSTFHATFDIKLFSTYVDKSNLILDFGCGYGRILTELSQYGFNRLYGVDFSEEMLKLAKNNCKNVFFCQNSSVAIPFKNESFDGIILSAVLTCIANKKNQDALMIEIERTLKKNGILYVTDFLINHDGKNINRYNEFPQSSEYPYGVFQSSGGGLLRHHTIEYINKLTSGFQIKFFQKTIFKTMLNNTSNGFIFIGIKKD